MNDTARTISVNPSLPTVGERYAAHLKEKALSAAPKINFEYTRQAPVAAAESGTAGILLSLVLGVSGRRDGMTAPMDSVTLVCRLGYGMLLVGSALLSGLHPASIVVLGLGTMTLLGFLMRPAMLGFAILQFTQAYFTQGDPTHSGGYLGLGVAAAVVAVLGPGHLSIDSGISYAIAKKIALRREKKLRKKRMSYEAFRYSGM